MKNLANGKSEIHPSSVSFPPPEPISASDSDNNHHGSKRKLLFGSLVVTCQRNMMATMESPELKYAEYPVWCQTCWEILSGTRAPHKHTHIKNPNAQVSPNAEDVVYRET